MDYLLRNRLPGQAKIGAVAFLFRKVRAKAGGRNRHVEAVYVGEVRTNYVPKTGRGEAFPAAGIDANLVLNRCLCEGKNRVTVLDYAKANKPLGPCLRRDDEVMVMPVSEKGFVVPAKAGTWWY